MEYLKDKIKIFIQTVGTLENTSLIYPYQFFLNMKF